MPLPGGSDVPFFGLRQDERKRADIATFSRELQHVFTT